MAFPPQQLVRLSRLYSVTRASFRWGWYLGRRGYISSRGASRHFHLDPNTYYGQYKGCPESIQPFWISREPTAWPWCNLAASQRRPYCSSVNSYSPVGLVSRQWEAVDWACVLCDRRIHNDRARRSASSRRYACPFYSSRAGFFGKIAHHPGLSAPLQPRFGPLQLLDFPKTKITVEREEICEYDVHTVHKLSQRRLTADWLAPRESDCSRMHNKVSSNWLPSYIKTTWPVLEILKMAG